MGGELERRPARLPVPVERHRKRESEAALPRAARAYRRNHHLTIPLTVPAACWTCALVLHSVPHGPGITLVGTGIAAAWTWGRAPGKWDRHEKWRKDEVLYARASALAAAAWLSLAAWLGPLSGSALWLLIVLLLGSAAWGKPWFSHYRPRGRKERMRLFREWDSPWQHMAPSLGLRGSAVIDVSESPSMTRVRIQLVRGQQTIADVRAALPRIESAIDDIDEGRVSVHAVKGHRSQVEIRIKRDNPLGGGVSWDESVAPRSVMDPWYPARTETGHWQAMTQLDGIWANGMKGSGKSTLLLARLLALAGCDDAFSVLIDLKGGRSARPVLEAGAADWVITDQAEAEMAYLLFEAEILARAEQSYDGHEQLRPSRQTPAIFIHVDEVHKLTSVAKGTAQAAGSASVVATTGRGSAVNEDLITQYGALEDSVRTESTRMNLGLRFAFKMPRAEHAAYAIRDWQQCDVSKLELAGECYAYEAGPGDGAQDSPPRLRVVNISHDEFRRLAPGRIRARGPKPRLKLWCGAQPCPAGGTWQEYLDSRWPRLAMGLRDISPQYQEYAAQHPGEDAGEVPATPAPAAPEPSPPSRARTVRPADPVAAEVVARLREDAEPYRDVPDGPLPAGAPRIADVQAAQEARMLDALAAAPPEGISVRQLCDASGLSSSTAYDKLGRLVAAGAAVKLRQGRYAPAAGADVRAAMAGVRSGDDALADQARRRNLHVVHTALPASGGTAGFPAAEGSPACTRAGAPVRA